MKMNDEDFLSACIEISAKSLTDEGFTPFGAIVVIDGVEIARGVSSVVILHDPTAHAEIMALRNAGLVLQDHRLPEATMYCSGEPCPMCLIACYWAGITRIVTAATIADSAEVGFEDAEYYSQLAIRAEDRSVQVSFGSSKLRERAAGVLRGWKTRRVGPS